MTTKKAGPLMIVCTGKNIAFLGWIDENGGGSGVRLRKRQRLIEA
ncbi:MAG: hypothetical protein WAM76_11595 [Pseudolabrys sp.]